DGADFTDQNLRHLRNLWTLSMNLDPVVPESGVASDLPPAVHIDSGAPEPAWQSGLRGKPPSPLRRKVSPSLNQTM
ncbi:MAG TPA: hypothetical protein VK530_12220, partial [Candidatus Acidoferrum sp.]|nr:hypothetical protein [Candidatus Acidoferrum sp.]